jgi:hypothetical protein
MVSLRNIVIVSSSPPPGWFAIATVAAEASTPRYPEAQKMGRAHLKKKIPAAK